jgi:hypothetical protein
VKQSVLLRIASDPIARVWGGIGDLIIPADIVEDGPAKYLGGGALLSLPDIEMGENAQAVRLDITVSGVNAKTLAIFRDESRTLKGSLAHIGVITFDDDWQIDNVEWITALTVGAPSFSSQGGPNGRTRSITISLGDWTDRNFPPLALWTDADQRRRSPTDAFFDHVSGITTGTSRQFGPSDAS